MPVNASKNRKLSYPRPRTTSDLRLTYQDTGGPISQWAVCDVGVSGDPPNVCRAPVDVVRMVVKHQFEGGGCVKHVAADCVKNSLKRVYIKFWFIISKYGI